MSETSTAVRLIRMFFSSAAEQRNNHQPVHHKSNDTQADRLCTITEQAGREAAGGTGVIQPVGGIPQRIDEEVIQFDIMFGQQVDDFFRPL